MAGNNVWLHNSPRGTRCVGVDVFQIARNSVCTLKSHWITFACVCSVSGSYLMAVWKLPSCACVLLNPSPLPKAHACIRSCSRANRRLTWRLRLRVCVVVRGCHTVQMDTHDDTIRIRAPGMHMQSARMPCGTGSAMHMCSGSMCYVTCLFWGIRFDLEVRAGWTFWFLVIALSNCR